MKNKFFTDKFVLAPKFEGCWQEWGIYMPGMSDIIRDSVVEFSRLDDIGEKK